GTHYVIRGKGTLKPGKVHSAINIEGSNDDLHVYVRADNNIALNRAVNALKRLIESATSTESWAVEYRQKQIYMLSVYNGTAIAPAGMADQSMLNNSGLLQLKDIDNDADDINNQQEQKRERNNKKQNIDFDGDEIEQKTNQQEIDDEEENNDSKQQESLKNKGKEEDNKIDEDLEQFLLSSGPTTQIVYPQVQYNQQPTYPHQQQIYVGGMYNNRVGGYMNQQGWGNSGIQSNWGMGGMGVQMSPQLGMIGMNQQSQFYGSGYGLGGTQGAMQMGGYGGYLQQGYSGFNAQPMMGGYGYGSVVNYTQPMVSNTPYMGQVSAQGYQMMQPQLVLHQNIVPTSSVEQPKVITQPTPKTD
ncbi:MAG: hypothetical protein EZS28_021448, partial [Streblomastix strix]